MPSHNGPTEDNSYGPLVALVFVFNLMVGTGALTMPAAFSDAGWLLSAILVFMISFMSYVTVTFIIESMSIANAVQKAHRFIKNNSQLKPRISMYNGDDFLQGKDEETDEQEDTPLMRSGRRYSLVRSSSSSSSNSTTNSDEHGSTHLFDITEKVELGQMAKMFFSNTGLNAFYVCISLYLYGDLAIYAAAISKSLRDVLCNYENCTQDILSNEDQCWIGQPDLSRAVVYRMLILSVACALGPFTFFNVQKTKYLQICTSMLRWLAFTIMILLSFIAIFEHKNEGHPAKAKIFGVPSIFGICVYSFMCHHSLPSLITPINNKKRLHLNIGLVYMVVLAFYYLLSFTGIFTFPQVEDVYTLNFQRERCVTNSTHSSIVPEVKFFEYFLPLFPVFTLGTSFPIIAITLTNNLKALLLHRLTSGGTSPSRWRFFVNQLLFPLLALIPPILIALATENMEVLVGFVGSYAGTGIQYCIPALLTYYAREKLEEMRELSEVINSDLDTLADVPASDALKRRFESPFKHRLWIHFVLGWSVICILFVTINHFIE